MRAPWGVRSTSKSIQARVMRQGLLVLVALLPMGVMGVTVPSAFGLREEKSRAADVRQRLRERNELRARLDQWGDESSVETLQALDAMLERLVPSGVGPISEFGAIRHCASEVGVQLDEIRHVRSSNVPGARRIVVDEVRIELVSPTDDTRAFVRRLRDYGYPSVVLGFDIARENARTDRFQTELRLGFLRRSEPARTASPESQR
ncbi:MAG: hypothetical protein AAFZ87_05065 [Planctomycetota bacterium]